MRAEILVAIIGLAGAIVGGGMASLTTWFIARSERTKFARERVWDLRREAYTHIIGSLVRAARLATHMHSRFQFDPHGYHSSREMRKAADQYAAHVQAAQDAYYTHRLVLSAPFAEMFERILWSLGEISGNPNLTPPEMAERTAERMKRHTTEILDVAVREITSATRG